MKNFKRLTAVLLLVAIMLVMTVPAFGASSGTTLVYSKDTNSGTRDVLCTTLAGTSVGSYYTGANTYDNLSALSGTALYDQLNSLMVSTHNRNSTYNNCRDMADETDCEANDGKINLIYSSFKATSGQSGSGGAAWNREHVWPKSLGHYETSGPGADLHHIRPSDCKINSTRGNLKYGNVSSGSSAMGSLASGISGGTYNSSYFEPVDNAKGDVARICLYMYVRYGKDSSYNCGNIKTIFQSVDVLLEWCALDPVDTWEMGRNEVIADFQGNRNVFIDYPELAWQIFGKEVPAGMSTPSGITTGGGTTGGGTTGGGTTGGGTTGGGTTGGGTVETPETEAELVDAAWELPVGETLGYHTLTGVISSLEDYSAQYNNRTVTIVVAGKSDKPIIAFRLKGDGVANLKVGDTIEVTGELMNYDDGSSAGSVEFNSGCTFSIVSTSTGGGTTGGGTTGGGTTGGGTTGGGTTGGGTTGGGTTECAHTYTEIRGKVDATCDKQGYSGDSYCLKCGELVKQGSETSKSANHTYKDVVVNGEVVGGICTVCGETKDSETKSPDNNTTVIVVSAVAATAVVGVGVGIFFLVRKRRMV